MKSKSAPHTDKAFSLASRIYKDVGVDVEAAMKRMDKVAISLHCWQGDDVGGFEGGGDPGGGLAVTGNYPGKARTPDELRADLDAALSVIPGRHRLNLHAFYGEFGGKKVERDKIGPEHFENWIAWAKERRMGMDFNPTCFAHPKAADGFTLSHPKKSVREFWIRHCQASRRIAAHIGRKLGSACVNNIWIPDGYKDTPADRISPRRRLRDSLDRVFAEKLPAAHMLDAVESKLFGIGSESYVVGSHEFYLGYAVRNRKLLCLDAGHFHPTEGIADKLSSVLMFVPQVLLHVSRGVRWDSDHVVVLDDALLAITRELVTGQLLDRTHIGLDFFDASINRIAAWAIGTRSTLKALLIALLEPPAARAAEAEGDLTARLAAQEDARGLPWAAVWNAWCERHNTPPDGKWLDEVRRYERDVLAHR